MIQVTKKSWQVFHGASASPRWMKLSTPPAVDPAAGCGLRAAGIFMLVV